MAKLPSDSQELENSLSSTHGKVCSNEEHVCDKEELNLKDNNEAITILLYPPRNKRFKFDNESHTIGVESISPEDYSQGTNNPSEEATERSEILVNEEPPKVVDLVELTSSDMSTASRSLNNERFLFDVKHKVSIKNSFKSIIGTPCFLKGCKWSPDGYCLLTCSNDNVLRIFEPPNDLNNGISNHSNNDLGEMKPVLKMKEGGTIYDFSWYPLMNSSSPLTCVLISTSQNSPIHLWDAYTGYLRGTYQPIDQFDEVTSALSLAFSTDGSKIYSGFKRCVRIFDISRPGRQFEQRNLKQKDSVFQSNIISAIAVNPLFPSIYALGAYDKSVGIYTEPHGELQCLLKGHSGGITHLMFSEDGTKLFTGARKDSSILCWDLRRPGDILFSVQRRVATNQRIYFDVKNSNYLATGSTDGKVDVYDIKETNFESTSILKPIHSWKAHNDCVNGVDFHPFFPLLATSSGQRHLNGKHLIEDEEEKNDENSENCVKIWSYFSR